MKLISFMTNVSNWILRLAYVNFLWILFSLFGLIFFGIFPSTIALFSIVRQWIRNGTSFSIWSYFKKVYKEELLKGNLLGYLYLSVGIVTYLDFRFFYNNSDRIFVILSYVFLVFLLLYIIIGVYLLPVYVHYDLKGFQYIKKTFLLIGSKPFKALVGLLLVIFMILLLLLLPSMLVFFGMSLLSLTFMWFSSKSMIEC